MASQNGEEVVTCRCGRTYKKQVVPTLVWQESAISTQVPGFRMVSEDFLNRVDGVCSLLYHRHRTAIGDEVIAQQLQRLYGEARLLIQSNIERTRL